MSIDHTLETGLPSSDQSNFRLAENQAAASFHGHVQRMPHADQRIPAATDNGNLGLPELHYVGTGSLAAAGRSTEHGSPFGNDLAGRIVKAIGANEGSLTHITKNDNGHGISIGIRQCNQECGELPDLLKSMHARDARKFNTIFGPYANDMTHEAWVRHANIAGNPDLIRRMSAALRDPEFQQVQIDKARQFAQQSVDTAKRYGLQTEQGAALVADITNQLGAGGARRIFARAGLHPGGSVKNEKAALQAMERLTHRPNSRDRFNTIASTFGKGALIDHRQMADGSDVSA